MNILKYIIEMHIKRANMHGCPVCMRSLSSLTAFFFFILLVASNCKMSNTGIIELDDAASNNLMMESTSFCHVNMATEA